MKYDNEEPKNLGDQAKLNIKDYGELELLITGGDHCPNKGADRSVSILLHCNPQGKHSEPIFIEEDESVSFSSSSIAFNLSISFY